jgi:hypothetical protein
MAKKFPSKISKHESHRLLALEQMELAELALDSRNYNASIGCSHMALELIMKSAIYKAGGVPPTSSVKGHDLLEISKVKIGNRKFLHSAICSDVTILPLWLIVYNRWDTSKRYEYLELDPLEMDDLISKYRRVFIWIKSKFVD